MPVDPISVAGAGPEWQIAGPQADPEFTIGGLEGDAGTTSARSGFGALIQGQLEALAGTQNVAAEAARSLATGQASDPSAAIVAIDRARLAMQLAAQIRTKGVESFQELMRTQI